MHKTHIFDQKNNAKNIYLPTYLPYFFPDRYRKQSIYFSWPMCMYMYICVCVYVCMFVCVCMFIYVCVYVCLYVCMYAGMYKHVCTLCTVCIYFCMYLYGRCELLGMYVKSMYMGIYVCLCCATRLMGTCICLSISMLLDMYVQGYVCVSV